VAVITRSQVIRKPVDEVFDAVIDGGNFAEWNPTIRASRRLDEGEIGEGSRFEWDLRGFGKVVQELQEFERNERVRIVPHIKTLAGGHRFNFTAQGDQTRVDHELEMRPKGLFKLFAPMMGMIGRKNLRDTANALQAHLEGVDRRVTPPRAPTDSEGWRGCVLHDERADQASRGGGLRRGGSSRRVPELESAQPMGEEADER
jgi:uncharacterized protein YndB with AHSA1/START domain